MATYTPLAPGVLWTTWCLSNTASTSFVTWDTWNRSTAATSLGPIAWSQPPETPEEREDFSKKLAEARRLADERKKRLEAADARAEELLKSVLDAGQREQYEREKRFHVVTTSGRRYRVQPGWGHNVHTLDQHGNPETQFCLVARDRVPLADLMVTQKLLLEHDEAQFLRVANQRSVRAM